MAATKENSIRDRSVEKLSDRINAAVGNEKADLVLKGGNVVDVFNQKIISGTDVAICGSYIVGIGRYSGREEIDVSGKYIIPGLIDSHVHIESSFLIPSEYAKAVVMHGVTTIIADPHEIANVCGVDGMDYMLEDGEKSLINIQYMVPSCVPATEFDHSGAVITKEDIEELLTRKNVVGLGEMMNYPGVISCDDDVINKLSVTDFVDGHSPTLGGRGLCAYINGGVMTDHECISAKEAREKVSMGMNVLIREGTGSKNLEELIRAVTVNNSSSFAFCTDDKDIDEILRDGTIRNCVRKAISLGLRPQLAIKLATINAARIYGQKKRGAIAPSYYADIVVADSLKLDNIEMVFCEGRLAFDKRYLAEADDQAGLDETKMSADEIEEINMKSVIVPDTGKTDTSRVSDTVHLNGMITPDDLHVEFDPDKPVIYLKEGSLITEPIYLSDPTGLVMLANIERHHNTGFIGKAFAMGLDIRGGAVAQSIGHDSHNITVVGDNTEDMVLAVNALGKSGGIAVVKDGKVIGFMPLPIGGIMTDLPALEADEQFDKIREAIELIGPGEKDSNSILMVLSFSSLLVIPHIKLGDRGLFDVDNNRYL